MAASHTELSIRFKEQPAGPCCLPRECVKPQGDHLPEKPGKLSELQSAQGKIREMGKSPAKP